jgi:hypothetical protein
MIDVAGRFDQNRARSTVPRISAAGATNCVRQRLADRDEPGAQHPHPELASAVRVDAVEQRNHQTVCSCFGHGCLDKEFDCGPGATAFNLKWIQPPW